MLRSKKEAAMKWKKVLSITAATVIPGGLVLLGGWLVMKKLRSSHDAKEKPRSDLAKQGHEQAKEEATASS
jgi:hypothetical protein